MNAAMRNYISVTAAYWVFTLTDGALRMLVVLYFHQLGYSPLQVASLFLFYEFFGVVTNLFGGWLGARLGLNATLFGGLALQVVALGMLAVDPAWLSVAYVMAAQALSGIAKDLTKMSSKSTIKLIAGDEGSKDSTLFKWVAVLTGSKNALKGVGFFLGAALLSLFGFRASVLAMAAAIALALVGARLFLSGDLGKAKGKVKFTQIFSKTPAVNILSAARFFLFGARDVWFVVALPVFLAAELGWDFWQVGGFLAAWVIGYGFVQAATPRILRGGEEPDGRTALRLAFGLAVIPAGIALALAAGVEPAVAIVVGLIAFAVVFAVNSAVHSFLILAYTDSDKVALNVGFYYMANAGGRLIGTVLSGLVFQLYGLEGCLWVSTIFVLVTGAISLALPANTAPRTRPIVLGEGAE
jgi:predicted MFS family arabinose efflux permease